MLMPGLFASVVDVSAGCLLRISRRLSLELEISVICRFGGTVVKSTGDGHLATFDGPTQAIRCAEALRTGVEPLGIEIRAGIHSGECELLGTDIGGIAVHIAARILGQAGSGEIL